MADEVSLIVAAAGFPSVHASTSCGAGSSDFPQTLVRPGSAVWRRAPAVFIDLGAARLLSGDLGCAGPVFLVRADLQEEDLEAEDRIRPDFSARLPADNIEVIGKLGRPGADDVASASGGDHGRGAERVAEPDSLPRAGRAPGGYCCVFTPAVGGAGASVLAAAMARLLSRERATCLVDVDEFSGGADLLLGMESAEGLRWGEFELGAGRLDGEALFEALPEDPSSPGLRVLTCSRSRGVMPTAPGPQEAAEVVSCLLGAGIAVVADAPRGTGWWEAIGSLADDFVLVVPASVRAIAAAGHISELCEGLGIRPQLVVRNVRHREISVADIEYALGLPIIGEVDYVKNIGRDIDIGGLGGGGVGSGVGRLAQGLESLLANAYEGGAGGYGRPRAA